MRKGSLKILWRARTGGELVFVREPVRVAAPEVGRTFCTTARATYLAAGERELAAVLERRTCTDAMSGEAFETAATVTSVARHSAAAAASCDGAP